MLPLQHLLVTSTRSVPRGLPRLQPWAFWPYSVGVAPQYPQARRGHLRWGGRGHRLTARQRSSRQRAPHDHCPRSAPATLQTWIATKVFQGAEMHSASASEREPWRGW